MVDTDITLCLEHETVNCGCVNAERYTLVFGIGGDGT